MKLYQFTKNEDYGLEYIFKFFELNNICLLQLGFYFEEDPDQLFLQIYIGRGCLFDLIFILYKFSFAMTIFGKNWETLNDEP